ncbi:MAG TPA: hypothetical protein PLE19_12715 [Planctomycetota bacterium]|nr:hypothetical protein [Planctomycetota bacterium]HRT95523.1 hypothetical protein [Planctomycetota bacterium]
MMIFLDFTQFGPPEAKAAGVTEGLARGLHAALEHWQARYKDRHFTFEAYSLYGYQPRTEKHEFRKAKRFKHRNPLVFTGRSREATKVFRTKLVAGGERGIKRAYGVHENLPQYFYMWRGGAPHKAEELYRTIEPEEREFRAIVLAHVEQGLAGASKSVQRERVA